MIESLPCGQVFRHKGDKVWKAANIGNMCLKVAKWDAVCTDFWRKPKIHQAHLHAWQLAKLAHQVAVVAKELTTTCPELRQVSSVKSSQSLALK